MSEDSLKKRAFYAAKDGMPIALYALLSNKTEEETNELLNQTVIEEDGQQCTPLIVAARCGHEKVVKILLSNFRPDLEAEGVVKFDGFVIEGASALWCAAGGGHLNIVKLLVKAGADVNHPTRTNSTPLRAACFDGRLDIVKYLTNHCANINIANKYNNTCLMIAAYKGHLDIVTFLLESGADPNEKATCGATALHFAAECGHTSIVKELLRFNAKFFVNDVGMTPIKAAAERTRRDVVEYLVQLPEISKETKIEALELLGASFANDKDNYCLETAFQYLYRTMEMRYSDPNNVIKKPLTKPIPAYENWVECQNLNELEAIRRNSNSLHMESLTIRERILGVNNPEVPHPVIFRGAVFADNSRFDRCIDLWMHALNLRQMNHFSVCKDLLRFAQVFSQMLHIDVQVPQGNVVGVATATMLELKRNMEKMEKRDGKDNLEKVLEEMESNVITMLYLLTLLTKVIKHCEEEQKFNVYRMVFMLNQMNVRLRDGQTFLHLACNAETPVDDFHTNDVCKFPCAETARLLVQCGADVNAMDNDRNTPLHIIVNYNKPMSDFMTLHSIIMDLTEAGAHIDCVNNKGETPLDASTTGVAAIILKTQVKLNLKCIAARAVKSHNLSYVGQVPAALENFIELHGASVKKF